jgi:hypothetical protein
MANETEWQPITQLLAQWRTRAQYAQYCHFAAANYLRNLHYYLGIPSIFLSTLVGTSIFATLEQHDGNHWMRITVGLISVLTAGLSTVQTFLRFEERAERHRTAGTQYGKLGRMMEQFYLLYHAYDVVELHRLISEIREQLDELDKISPEIPQHIWSRRSELISGEAQARDASQCTAFATRNQSKV